MCHRQRQLQCRSSMRVNLPNTGAANNPQQSGNITGN
jgi:hypothetical protein